MTRPREPFTDVLVLLPGIAGSALRKNGRPLWDLEKGAVARALWNLRDTVDALRLDGDAAVDDEGDGVEATALLDDAHLIPGLVKIDGYGGIRCALQERLTLEEGENYFEFPYDWRRDNRHAARRLARATEAWLERWRVRSGNKDARLVLVGHSMGGLVARYFLECLEGWRSARALITFGTPYRGSITALTILANGVDTRLGLLAPDFTGALRSMTSVYQLLPTWACVDTGGGERVRIADLPDAGRFALDPDKLRAGLGFHDEITAAVAQNRARADWAGGYAIHPVVGTRQPTPIAAREGRRGRLDCLFDFQGRTVDGDGLVSRVSAVPRELSNAGREVFVAARHASMQNADNVVHHVASLLAGQSLDLAMFFGRGPAQLGLELDDVQTCGEPIRLRVLADDDPGPLTVTVDALGGGSEPAAVSQRVEALPDDGVIALPSLPPGAYRVRIGGEGVEGLTDLFVVAPPPAS